MKRAIACGAMRRRGSLPKVKLKPRNLRTLGLATALLALLTFSLELVGQEPFNQAMTRSPARLAAHIDVAVSGVGEFHPHALAETDVRTLASSGSHCSAASLQKTPVSEQIRLAARDALQPLL